MVRVIGGSARGRILRAPRSAAVRPTADRVREAVFDVLTHLGVLSGARVLDGFAGSGALGIEALSRGAAAVTFVEADRVAAAQIEENLQRTGFSGHGGVRVLRGDLFSFLAGGPRFDLVLLDPPYRFAQWDRLLPLVRSDVVVLESDRPVALPATLELHRHYRYGTTLVSVARQVRDGGEQCATPRPGEPEPAGAERKERS